jgi:tripartite-type tricarboxylate transporter receptor subunit TctC
MDHPAGFEPAASGLANRCSLPLSYGWNGVTPQEFDAWIRRDYEKWRRVIQETGIKIAK